MLLRMDYLANTVFSAFGARTSSDQSIVEIRNVHIWNGTYSEDSAPVYIINASQLPELDLSDSSNAWVLICIEDVPVDEKYLSLNHVHFVLLPETVSVADAVNAITSLFSKTSNSLDLFTEVLKSISHTDGKGDFSESISKMLSCPAALVDDSFNDLSSYAFDLVPEQWNSHLSAKKKQMVHLPKKYNYEGFSISPLKTPIAQYEYEVIFPIYADNSTKIVEGAIYFLSPDLILPTGFSEILRFTAHALSWVLWKHLRQSKGSPAAQNHLLLAALTDMLYGNAPKEESLKKVLSLCTYNVNQDFVLVVVEASAAQNTETPLDIIVNAFGEYFPDSLTLCFSGDIISLLPVKYLKCKDAEELWSNYSSMLKNYGCFAGISTVFHSIDSYFIHHYIRALSAARIARDTNNEKNYASYNEESLYHIIANGPPPFNLKALCDPYLLEMIRHDEKYGTEYFYTLSCYWQLDRDNTRICNYMHIHKNTLYYRIAKIKALLHQDIDSHACFMQLILSVAILETLGTIPRYRIIDEEAYRKAWTFDSESTS